MRFVVSVPSDSHSQPKADHLRVKWDLYFDVFKDPQEKLARKLKNNKHHTV
jgi:hypothetical protein